MARPCVRRRWRSAITRAAPKANPARVPTSPHQFPGRCRVTPTNPARPHTAMTRTRSTGSDTRGSLLPIREVSGLGDGPIHHDAGVAFLDSRSVGHLAHQKLPDCLEHLLLAERQITLLLQQHQLAEDG